MDFEAAAKLSGARFVVLKGALARLERALMQFMLDLHTDEHGYTEINPPVLVRDAAMFGTAQLPKFGDDQFFPVDTQRLVASCLRRRLNLDASPTQSAFCTRARYTRGSCAALCGARRRPRERFLAHPDRRSADDQPRARNRSSTKRNCRCASPRARLCFRAEAGAAGKDTRGMIRQHQFDKVELVSITTPEQSADEHERMTACAEEVLKRLGLHFRTIALCTGDMGFASRKTYDIEVWLPGQGRFREISSCSNCGDFQARRMAARCKAADAKATRFVHTLNGSGVAVGRALVAVIENYQNPDGSIAVPDALRPYMRGVGIRRGGGRLGRA